MYSPPTLLDLRGSISRDVHDPTNKTFSTVEVTDLINAGIAELNMLRPIEYLDDVPLVSDIFVAALPDIRVDQVFRVEIWRDGEFYRDVPRKDGPSSTGWDFFAGQVLLPHIIFDASVDQLRVYGYRTRDPVSDDADVLEVDMQGEQLIRTYSQYDVFRRLIASRSLFQQWQTNSNNADISATQLSGFASLYASTWRDQRMRMKRLRRTD